MPLQIRRGTNTQRSGLTFAEGEIVYTIDTKKLYVGDGSTVGGIDVALNTTLPEQSGNQGKFLTTNGNVVSWADVPPSGLASVSADTSPQLGGNLNLNSHNITGNGSISLTGSITVSNELTITNNVISTNSIPLFIKNDSFDRTISVEGLTDGTIDSATSIEINSSRGSLSAPTTTLANDYVGRFSMSGWDGSAWKPTASMYASWAPNANLGDDSPASRLTFVVGAGGSSTSSLFFNSNGVLQAPVLSTGLYAGSGEYPVFLNPAYGAGSIIFDSVTKHFMGFDGTSWVQLS